MSSQRMDQLVVDGVGHAFRTRTVVGSGNDRIAREGHIDKLRRSRAANPTPEDSSDKNQ